MSAMKRRAKVIAFPRTRVGGAGRVDGNDAPADALAEVRRCRDQTEALVVRGLLESEGIPAVLRGRMVQSVHPFTVGDLAEVRVLVHAADAERARHVLGRPARRRRRPGGAPARAENTETSPDTTAG